MKKLYVSPEFEYLKIDFSEDVLAYSINDTQPETMATGGQIDPGDYGDEGEGETFPW